MEAYKLHVGGAWIDADGGATYPTENPFDGEAWAVVADASAADVERAVAAARAALDGEWGSWSGFERARAMRRLAALIGRDAERLAAIETRDNGKLLREMSGQVERLPGWLEWFAGEAERLGGEVIPVDRGAFHVYTRREPVGVVAAIVPWNSPLLLLMWKLAPALAAGCTLVVKPADDTPVSALELSALAVEAGIPPGVLNVVTGRGPALGKALVAHPGVDKIAFTGSTAVGTEVARSAADRLARVTLELGGKSAQVVFADADLEAAANGIVAGVFAAAGQTCIAGSRLIVATEVADELVERVAERARRIVLGDPMEAATEMGPLANPRQLEAVTGFVERAIDAGARAVTGGAPSAQGGLFVDPTILVGVQPSMEIAREEVFGPVLAVMRFDTEDEAVAFANDSAYGLAAGVWTADVRRAHRVAQRLRAGSVWVNAYRAVAPNVPFGGVGMSGFGRENGRAALDEYTELKAVWVELSGATRDPFTLG